MGVRVRKYTRNRRAGDTLLSPAATKKEEGMYFFFLTFFFLTFFFLTFFFSDLFFSDLFFFFLLLLLLLFHRYLGY